MLASPRTTVTDPFDAGLAPIVYRIDERDEIVFVNDAWRSFAHANDAPAVAEVIGQSLWTSITGAETATLWREVLARVRAGAGFSLPYRCDAPGRRRTLRMQLKPLPHGGVEFVSSLIRAEDRDPVALLASHYGRGEPIRSCSWCRRFDAGGFIEVEVAIARLGLLEQELRDVTHVLCSDCAEDVRRAAGLGGAERPG